MKLVWDESAWEDYLWWQGQDRKTFKRINTLIKEIARSGNDGMGKPEPLRHGFEGYWSRRITDEHRLVYRITDDEIRVAACRYRYERLSRDCPIAKPWVWVIAISSQGAKRERPAGRP